MKSRIVVTILLAAVLLVVMLAVIVPDMGQANAANLPPQANPDSALQYPPANPGSTDLVSQGTMWQPQDRKSFKQWIVYAWGVETMRKPTKPMDQWVHIGVPMMTYFNSVPRYVKFVEFCAASTNGSVTKPTALDLWDNKTLIGHYPISWPADNAVHCSSKGFAPAVWRSALGVSVSLHFANPDDKIVLYKAWASVSDAP